MPTSLFSSNSIQKPETCRITLSHFGNTFFTLPRITDYTSISKTRVWFISLIKLMLIPNCVSVLVRSLLFVSEKSENCENFGTTREHTIQEKGRSQVSGRACIRKCSTDISLVILGQVRYHI